MRALIALLDVLDVEAIVRNPSQKNHGYISLL
jgi:hypothetical protein